MQLFSCQSCGQALLFENNLCERCGHELGFCSESLSLLALEPKGKVLRPVKGGQDYLRCANAQYGACNWLIAVSKKGKPTELCAACRHNKTIPDLSDPANLKHWQDIEIAKHRLFYTLLRLGLPHPDLAEDPEHGLAFDFLADPPGPGPRILTGHDEGLITINLKEADDAMREKFRTEMGEPYRTLLGHFRHEIGHYYWNVLVRDGKRLQACRAMFGDDSLDYGEALQKHYDEGPPANWADHYISAYATTHPWEDFAETWAHYLHIVDTLETAAAFGLRIHPRRTKEETLQADIDFSPYKVEHISQLIDAWLPLTFAMNSINRSMGHADLYPFVISPPVIEKLGFIHELVHGRVPQDQPEAPPAESAAPKQAQATPNPPPPSDPPAPPGPSPVPPPVEPPGPDIQPPIQEPPAELPPSEMPPPQPPGAPPPLQA
jgi:hypothetical protein